MSVGVGDNVPWRRFGFHHFLVARTVQRTGALVDHTPSGHGHAGLVGVVRLEVQIPQVNGLPARVNKLRRERAPDQHALVGGSKPQGEKRPELVREYAGRMANECERIGKLVQEAQVARVTPLRSDPSEPLTRREVQILAVGTKSGNRLTVGEEEIKL